MTEAGGAAELRARVLAEREAREAAERRLAERSAALDRAFDGVAITDAQGDFVYMNDSHARMFGWDSGADWIGRSWRALYGPEEAAMFERVVFPILHDTGGWRGEVAGRGRDGRPVYQEVTLSFLDTGLLCVTRDIGERRALETERRRLAERLLGAQALATLGRFSAALSHDFSAVIGAAAHNVETIAHADADAEARAAALEGLRASLDRARGLTRRMLSLGRPEAARSEEVDLAAVAAETFDLVFSGSDAAARFLSDGAAPLIGDRTQLEQLCANLLFNAEQACRGAEAREVTLWIEQVADREAARARDDALWPYGARGAAREFDFGGDDGPFWAVSVLDAGAGMSAAELDQLFEPFYSTKRIEERGHGLGLLSIETCLETHGGGIRYRSLQGSGTLASALLPLRPACGAAPAAPAHPGRPRAVVVDDEPAALRAMCAALTEAGVAPEAFTDPARALLAFAADPSLNALVADCALGEISGADLVLA
ncbi:MAG: ATP-binding protein, partial [Pseudomonadota bacterium]